MTDTKGPAGNQLRHLNTTIGNAELSAWLVAKGVCWLQTRNPYFTKLLKQRRDARLVARGVTGGYLRTYEVAKPLVWASRLVRRYQAQLTSAGTGITVPNPPPAASDSPNHQKTARRTVGVPAVKIARLEGGKP